MSDDRHAEHRRIDPERYGGPLSRPPLSPAGRRLIVAAAAALGVALLVVLVVLLTR